MTLGELQRAMRRASNTANRLRNERQWITGRDNRAALETLIKYYTDQAIVFRDAMRLVP